MVQGQDTTNRFLFLIPLLSLPAPVGANTVLTSTATLPDPVTSEFSPNVMVTQSPLPPPPPLPPVADVSVTKQANQTTAVLGAPVTFTIIAHNNGPDTATDVVVNDIPLGGLSSISATPSQGSFDPASGHWTVGTLANGATAILQLTGIVTANGPISNVAIETADEPDPDPSNDFSAVTIGLSKRSFLSSSDPPPNAAMSGLFNAAVSQWVNLWAARLSVAERLLAARNGPGNGGVPSF